MRVGCPGRGRRGGAPPSQGSGAAEPSHRLLVVDQRAGPRTGTSSTKPDRHTAYMDAVKSLDAPRHLRRKRRTCLVTWQPSGLEVVFAGVRDPWLAAIDVPAAYVYWAQRLGALASPSGTALS